MGFGSEAYTLSSSFIRRIMAKKKGPALGRPPASPGLKLIVASHDGTAGDGLHDATALLA